LKKKLQVETGGQEVIKVQSDTKLLGRILSPQERRLHRGGGGDGELR
jgi:hypothetical protein